MRQRLPVRVSTWSRRAVLLLEIGIILFWLGIALQNGRLILASAIIVSYLILSMLSTTRPSKTIALQRRTSTDRVLEEQPTEVTVSIRNPSGSQALVHGADTLPDSFEILEGSDTYVSLVTEKSETYLRGVIRPHFRGHYVLQSPVARVADEFGLREHEVGIGNPIYLTVLPPIEDLSDFSLESHTAQPEIGTFRSSAVGVGTEFFGIRDYFPGDDLRRINWKASARTDSLLSNEYEREHVTNIYLFVDLTGQTIDALKWTVRTAASITTYLLRTRNRLGLIVLGESTSHVKIESGRRQLLRTLDKLVTAEPGGTGEPSTYLLRLLDEMTRCEILFVSALSSEGISKTIIAARGKREQVTVITMMPSPETMEEYDPVRKAARLMYTLRRRATILQIKNADVRVIEVPSDRPIRTAVSMIRERPLRR